MQRIRIQVRLQMQIQMQMQEESRSNLNPTVLQNRPPFPRPSPRRTAAFCPRPPRLRSNRNTKMNTNEKTNEKTNTTTLARPKTFATTTRVAMAMATPASTASTLTLTAITCTHRSSFPNRNTARSTSNHCCSYREITPADHTRSWTILRWAQPPSGKPRARRRSMPLKSSTGSWNGSSLVMFASMSMTTSMGRIVAVQAPGECAVGSPRWWDRPLRFRVRSFRAAVMGTATMEAVLVEVLVKVLVMQRLWT
mmetsp:Transcript_7743/g.22681  ORF Transcript_7743/g.22681 Transcript_7743/m.22681 type:complete len:252 (-) Transcript_7743:1618-2373(-)